MGDVYVTTRFLWLFQLDDEPNHYKKKRLFHQTSTKKNGCLLAGGFKYCLFSSLFEEDSEFD